jgi:hypothetical protein
MTEKIFREIREYSAVFPIKELAERYETPLPEMEKAVEELEEKVNAHLERMGVAWN